MRRSRPPPWVSVCSSVGSVAQAANPWSLLPQPVEARLASGPPIQIANGASVDVRGAHREEVAGIADRFVKLVAETRGLQLRVAEKSDAHAAITFDVDPKADVVGDAGYRIVVENNGIRVIARTPQGAVLRQRHRVSAVDAAGLDARIGRPRSPPAPSSIIRVSRGAR